jgi:DNA-binding transcriptional ArsR family regulator
MPITLRFSPADLRRCRFAMSPAFETLAAIRVLTGPQRPDQHEPWARSARVKAAGLDLRPITLLQPRRGYTPDFLAPPPAGPSAEFADELARIAATPHDRVTEEVGRALADTPGAADSSIGRLLIRGEPERVLAMLTELIEATWRLLVKPVWPRIRGLIDADIAFQSQRLAAGGLDLLFHELHPTLHWRDNVLTRQRGDEHRDLTGEGLVLMPSAFKWDQVVVVTDPPWQPTVIYPARGLGALWLSSSDAEPTGLRRLIGRSRAMLLTGLTVPASTVWLAHRYALAPATVSQHLSILRDAGLVVGERHRHEVRYRRTRLGTSMVNGEVTGATSELQLGGLSHLRSCTSITFSDEYMAESVMRRDCRGEILVVPGA